MILTLDQYEQGAFAVVFFDKENNKAYKVFKSFDHPEVQIYHYSKEQFYTYRRNVFSSERNAYELIQNSNMKMYFPNYYPNIEITSINDITGTDISNQFLLDCCLTLDFISGISYKQSDFSLRKCVAEKGKDLSDIFQELEKVGIQYWQDANVFCSENEIKIIDIAVEDSTNFEIIDDTSYTNPYDKILGGLTNEK